MGKSKRRVFINAWAKRIQIDKQRRSMERFTCKSRDGRERQIEKGRKRERERERKKDRQIDKGRKREGEKERET